MKGNNIKSGENQEKKTLISAGISETERAKVATQRVSKENQLSLV